jgi:hypothetical protein
MTGSNGNPKTLAELFARMCTAYGREPNDDVFSIWRAALGDTPVPELWTAFIAHLRDTRLDVRDGRPVGRWFPSPAELLAQIEAIRRSEFAKRGPRPYCGGKDCWGGWISAGGTQDSGVVRCPNCVALWEVWRADPAPTR